MNDVILIAAARDVSWRDVVAAADAAPAAGTSAIRFAPPLERDAADPDCAGGVTMDQLRSERARRGPEGSE